jgi:hypothetical protein
MSGRNVPEFPSDYIPSLPRKWQSALIIIIFLPKFSDHYYVWLSYEGPYGRPNHRYRNIKVGLKGRGCDVVDWMYLPQNGIQWQAVVKRVMKLQVSYKAGYLIS